MIPNEIALGWTIQRQCTLFFLPHTCSLLAHLSQGFVSLLHRRTGGVRCAYAVWSDGHIL